jgi:hypothetical protein
VKSLITAAFMEDPVRGGPTAYETATSQMAPPTTARSAGTPPAAIREPIKISIAIAIRNANTGLSKTTAAIIDNRQVGKLLMPLPPVNIDLGHL